MGILEIVMFNIDKARSLTPRLATTLEQLLKLFCKNTYILEYYNNLVAIKERSNGLQEQEEYREEEKVLEDCPYPYSPCYFDSGSDMMINTFKMILLLIIALKVMRNLV